MATDVTSGTGSANGGGTTNPTQNQLPWHLIPAFKPGTTDVNDYARRLNFLNGIWPSGSLSQLAPRAALLCEGISAFQRIVRLDPSKLRVNSSDGVKADRTNSGRCLGQNDIGKSLWKVWTCNLYHSSKTGRDSPKFHSSSWSSIRRFALGWSNFGGHSSLHTAEKQWPFSWREEEDHSWRMGVTSNTPEFWNLCDCWDQDSFMKCNLEVGNLSGKKPMMSTMSRTTPRTWPWQLPRMLLHGIQVMCMSTASINWCPRVMKMHWLFITVERQSHRRCSIWSGSLCFHEQQWSQETPDGKDQIPWILASDPQGQRKGEIKDQGISKALSLEDRGEPLPSLWPKGPLEGWMSLQYCKQWCLIQCSFLQTSCYKRSRHGGSLHYAWWWLGRCTGRWPRAGIAARGVVSSGGVSCWNKNPWAVCFHVFSSKQPVS